MYTIRLIHTIFIHTLVMMKTALQTMFSNAKPNKSKQNMPFGSKHIFRMFVVQPAPFQIDPCAWKLAKRQNTKTWDSDVEPPGRSFFQVNPARVHLPTHLQGEG